MDPEAPKCKLTKAHKIQMMTITKRVFSPKTRAQRVRLVRAEHHLQVSPRSKKKNGRDGDVIKVVDS
jgi:hypothetical protein